MWFLEVHMEGRKQPLKEYRNIKEAKFKRLLRKIDELQEKNRNLYCIYWFDRD